MTLHESSPIHDNHDARHLLPLCGRRWPREAGSDEGSQRRLHASDSDSDPHPTLADARATFSHEWEKETRTTITLSGGDAHDRQ